MLTLLPQFPRGGIRIPKSILTPGEVVVPPPAPGVYTLDCTVHATEDPVSDGGVLTNNTQATGGNTVYGLQSSMRIIAAATGGINITTGDALGQSVPPAAADYLDSFAFKPGYPGNQRITGVVYVQPGYGPIDDSHEIGLLCGCMTSSSGGGIHRWIQFNWGQKVASGRFMATFGSGVNGTYPGAPNDYFILSPTDSGALNRILVDGDIMMLEYDRTVGSLTSYLNGTQIQTITDLAGFNALVLGDGVGWTQFRRTDNGQSASDALGFKSVVVEEF
jgi:hypothetical protein